MSINNRARRRPITRTRVVSLEKHGALPYGFGGNQLGWQFRYGGDRTGAPQA